MPSSEDLKAYVDSFAVRVPEDWFIQFHKSDGSYLVMNRDDSGKVIGHMIDDDRFNRRLGKYLKSIGAKVIDGVTDIDPTRAEQDR